MIYVVSKSIESCDRIVKYDSEFSVVTIQIYINPRNSTTDGRFYDLKVIKLLSEF